MGPYWLLLLVSGVSGFFLCELKKSRSRVLLFVAALTCVMAAMGAIRNPTVGVDTKMYMEYFSGVCGQDFTFLFNSANLYWKEPGYGLLNFIVSRVTQNPQVLIGLVSALIIILRGIFIYIYSSSSWVSVFVYISFGFFGYALCTLRQELAISILLFALPFLQKRKLLPYALITVAAALFHASAWILLPIYFIANLPLNRIMLGVYAGGTLLLLLISEPLLAFVTKYVYKIYQPGSYYTMGRDYSTAVFPVVTFILALLLMKKLLALRPENRVLINYACYAGFLFVLTLKHFIFQRIALLFLPAALLLIPEFLRCVFPDSAKQEKLRGLLALDNSRKKQNREKIGELRLELKNEMALYYTVLGLILAGCMVYFLFLLTSNRLLLAPYHTIWFTA